MDIINDDTYDSLDDTILTTIDNPYDPRKEYNKWYVWDIENKYYTEEYLARMAEIPVDIELDDERTIRKLMNKAKNEILENDVLKIYKLV